MARLYRSERRSRRSREVFPALAEIVEWHVEGTRYGIGVDPRDGLLSAGEPGVQLTWMDAKVGDWVVTPRIGKPVEINALWYNALCVMAAFAETARPPGRSLPQSGRRARAGFARFADESDAADSTTCSMDPTGNDALGPAEPNLRGQPAALARYARTCSGKSSRCAATSC